MTRRRTNRGTSRRDFNRSKKIVVTRRILLLKGSPSGSTILIGNISISK